LREVVEEMSIATSQFCIDEFVPEELAAAWGMKV
jgi:hypothetical protein